MYKIILNLLVVCFVVSCNNKKEDTIINYPTEQYKYTSLDTSKVVLKKIMYVPIYSHIYRVNGTRPTLFAATLSIRSTDFSNNIYVTTVDYFNSKGEIIKKYIDKVLLLNPMNSYEFVVEESNTQGGAGAYFIVNWSALKPVNEPLVQAVMLSTTHSLGFSFKTEGVELNRYPN